MSEHFREPILKTLIEQPIRLVNDLSDISGSETGISGATHQEAQMLQCEVRGGRQVIHEPSGSSDQDVDF